MMAHISPESIYALARFIGTGYGLIRMATYHISLLKMRQIEQMQVIWQARDEVNIIDYQSEVEFKNDWDVITEL